MLSTSPCYSRLRHAGRSQGSGLRMRCCAAPPRPRRCHGDGAGRGLAEAWGALETGPFSNSLSSLSFLLSSLFLLFSFSFCCFPSLLVCSLFPQNKKLSSCIHIPFSFTFACLRAEGCEEVWYVCFSSQSPSTHTYWCSPSGWTWL